MTVRLGRLPCVGESLDAGLESPTRQRQVIVARGQGHEAGWSSPGPGPSSERPPAVPPVSSGSPLSPGNLTQELPSFPVNVRFQSKVRKRSFQTLGGSGPEEGSGLRGPLLYSCPFLTSRPPILSSVVMKCGKRKRWWPSEVGVAPADHPVRFFFLSLS